MMSFIMAIFHTALNLLAWLFAIVAGVGIYHVCVGRERADKDERQAQSAASGWAGRLEEKQNFRATFSMLDKRGRGLDIDENAQSIRIGRREYAFDDIVSVELHQSAEATSQKNRSGQIGAAVIGELALGPVGLLAGGLVRSKTVTKRRIRGIELKLTVADLRRPVHVFRFQTNTHEEGSFWHRRNLAEAEKWAVRLNVALRLA